MRRSVLSDAQRDLVLGWKAEGRTSKEIQKRLIEEEGAHVSLGTIYNVCTVARAKLPPQIVLGSRESIAAVRSGCDHRGNYCNCTLSTGKNYADYLREAGLKITDTRGISYIASSHRTSSAVDGGD